MTDGGKHFIQCVANPKFIEIPHDWCQTGILGEFAAGKTTIDFFASMRDRFLYNFHLWSDPFCGYFVFINYYNLSTLGGRSSFRFRFLSIKF